MAWLRQVANGLLLLVVIGLLWLALVAATIVNAADQSSEAPAQAALVLGAAAWGSRPSPVYRERLNEALRLYQEGRVQTLIFTGGTRDVAFPAEAEVAREYALHRGIPSSQILVDAHSHTTRENLEQARLLMTQAGINSVLMVSDPLHMERAMALARELCMDARPSPSDSSRFHSWSSRAHLLAHETFALAALRIRQAWHPASTCDGN